MCVYGKHTLIENCAFIAKCAFIIQAYHRNCSGFQAADCFPPWCNINGSMNKGATNQHNTDNIKT